MKRKTRIVLVDDNETFLEGIEALLETNNNVMVVASFSSGEDLLAYSHLNSVDLVLLDVEMPEMNGIQTAKYLNYQYPRIKIIAITMYQDAVYLSQLIESGFHGFVNKTNVSNELFSSISAIMQGDLIFPENIL